MSRRERSEPEGHTVSAASADSLEQVREILFGSHHRELARRLARTDAHVSAQAEDLRNEAHQRLDVLEAHLHQECDVLAASIAAQETAQRDALDKVARESRESHGSLEQRLRKLEELMARSQREYREQLLAQAKSFIDEVQRTRSELTAAIEREVAAAWAAPVETEAGAAPALEDAERHEPSDRHQEAA